MQSLPRYRHQGLPLLQLSSSFAPSIQTIRRASSTSAIVTRTQIDQLYKKIRGALDEEQYHVEILGAYRREIQAIEDAPILVTGLTDGRNPTSSKETYEEDSTKISEMLVSENILARNVHFHGKQRYSSSQYPALPISLQYVPKICQGAARLYLTGDASYIRFLKLMSMEAMGLSLNTLGLWKATETRQRGSPVPQGHSLLQNIEIEKIDKQESEGDRRMRETRKAMGLPDGLDLSLDLEAPSENRDTSQIIKSTPQDFEAELISRADDGIYTERISVGSGSEAEILDVLGLVWIPPQMRTVKGPT